jgi:type IV pilus assembly protein PilM
MISMASNGKPVRPNVAVEISAERVVAARASQERGAVELYTARPLPAGAVTPGLQEQNIHDRGALGQAIAAVLETVGPRGRDVTLVLPDAAVRVMLMDFDTFPDREADALSLLRFRLKKLLPFDAERAAISYQASRNGTVRVVTAVAASNVLEEYESVLRDAGVNPGVVLSSLVASLGLVDGAQPTLLLKADPGTISVAIADHGELRLVRTLEGEAPDTSEQLAEDIHPMMVFFEDTFGARIQRVVVAGRLRADLVGSALAAQTGARVEDLVSPAIAGSGSQVPPGVLAAVAGAVLEL